MLRNTVITFLHFFLGHEQNNDGDTIFNLFCKNFLVLFSLLNITVLSIWLQLPSENCRTAISYIHDGISKLKTK